MIERMMLDIDDMPRVEESRERVSSRRAKLNESSSSTRAPPFPVSESGNRQRKRSRLEDEEPAKVTDKASMKRKADEDTEELEVKVNDEI